MTPLRRSRLLIQGYILGLPLWWGLGFDFIVPLLLVLALMWASLAPHRRFTVSDYVLAAIVAALGGAAYLNGFLIAHEGIRVLAALNNLGLWLCGLLLLQQVRYVLTHDGPANAAILRTGFVAFCVFIAVAWGAFAIALAVGNYSLELPTLFGATLGHAVPDSAALIRQSSTMAFTRPDWGLPGVPMPRIMVYGPYPTATAAVVAVLGTLALLHLHQGPRPRAGAALLVEAVILATLVVTLTRSVIAGWIIGIIVANLVFGSVWRRIAGCGILAAGVLLVMYVDLGAAAEYRGYSTESRFENYDRAIERTFAYNPLLGLGIKPRETDNHIAVGSHSTFVSSFTKAGSIGLSLVVVYLVAVPALRWLVVLPVPGGAPRRSRATLRILLNLQVSVWIWLCFEDLDAPATAAMLIFIFFAFSEVALRQARRPAAAVLPTATALRAS